MVQRCAQKEVSWISFCTSFQLFFLFSKYGQNKRNGLLSLFSLLLSMSRPSIELFLHPPSPLQRPEEPCVVLPPVSSLLRDVPASSSTDETSSLPCLHQPEPPQIINDTKPCPALTLTISYDPSSATSPYSSPAVSPLRLSSLDTPQTSPSSSPHPNSHHPHQYFLLPPPCNTRRCRSLSNASTSSQSSVSTLPSPSFHRRLSDPPLYSAFDHDPSASWQRPQSASPSLSSSPLHINSPPAKINDALETPFVAKRKRGRPPNISRHVSQRDCWTFVTPTVWDVKRTRDDQQQQQQTTATASSSSLSPPPSPSRSNNMTVLVWPEAPSKTEEGLSTFTNTSLDNTLSMPKKKRGRKPKTQLAGNSCFVWRDLTARRGASRRKSSSSTTTTAAAITKHRHRSLDLVSRVENLKVVDNNNSG